MTIVYYIVCLVGVWNAGTKTHTNTVIHILQHAHGYTHTHCKKLSATYTVIDTHSATHMHSVTHCSSTHCNTLTHSVEPGTTVNNKTKALCPTQADRPPSLLPSVWQEHQDCAGLYHTVPNSPGAVPDSPGLWRSLQAWAGPSAPSRVMDPKRLSSSSQQQVHLRIKEKVKDAWFDRLLFICNLASYRVFLTNCILQMCMFKVHNCKKKKKSFIIYD